MKNFYNDLKHYGKIIGDKEHETTEGHFIRFTTYEYYGFEYVVTMFNGEVMLITKREEF